VWYKGNMRIHTHLLNIVEPGDRVRGVSTENQLKFAPLAVIAVPACFGVAYLIRKIPGVLRIL
jgi:hypothetical protein